MARLPSVRISGTIRIPSSRRSTAGTKQGRQGFALNGSESSWIDFSGRIDVFELVALAHLAAADPPKADCQRDEEPDGERRANAGPFGRVHGVVDERRERLRAVEPAGSPV